MPLPFVPPTGVAPADLFEDLTRDLVTQYVDAETRILEQLQRRIDRHLTDPEPRELLMAQLRQIRSAQRSALDAAVRLRLDPDLGDRLLRTAIAEGAAAAADRLGLVRVLPDPGPLTSTSASATVQVALDLRSTLDDVKARILRYEADAYQSLVAGHLPAVLLGTQYSLDAQRAAVAHWLADGIPAFVDKAGRQWAVGSYVEMATRTGLARAYLEASLYRQQQSGLDLVTIVVGASACESCARAIGKILSTGGGAVGDVELPHATTGEPTTVHVDGTLASFRTGHLFGPNCRCIAVPYMPGLSIPAGATTYDPVKEKARDRQRALERSLRADKRKLALSPTEAEQRELRARIRGTQQTLREHIAEHDLPRKAYREQPHFADGRPTPPSDAPRAPRPPAGPPEPPTPTPGPTPAPGPAPTPAPVPKPDAPPAGSTAPAGQPALGVPRELPPSLSTEIEKKSVAAVAELAATRHGIPFEGFAGRPAANAKAAIVAVSDFLDRYPGIRLTEVAVRQEAGTSRNTLAYVSVPRKYAPDGSIVSMTPRMVVTPGTLDSTRIVDGVERSNATGHFHNVATDPAGAIRYVITHEMGHALDANVEWRLSAAFEQLRDSEREKALASIPESDARARNEARVAWEKANLSGYGRGSVIEGTAEAFADALTNGDAAFPLSRKFLPIAEQIIEEEL